MTSHATRLRQSRAAQSRYDAATPEEYERPDCPTCGGRLEPDPCVEDGIARMYWVCAECMGAESAYDDHSNNEVSE